MRPLKNIFNTTLKYCVYLYLNQNLTAKLIKHDVKPEKDEAFPVNAFKSKFT